jgi:hypothetical protein
MRNRKGNGHDLFTSACSQGGTKKKVTKMNRMSLLFITMAAIFSDYCYPQQIDSLFGGLTYGMTGEDVLRSVESLGQRPQITSYEDKPCMIRFTEIVWSEYAEVSANLCGRTRLLRGVVVTLFNCEHPRITPPGAVTASSDCIKTIRRIKKILSKKYGPPINSREEGTNIPTQVWQSSTSVITIESSWPMMIYFGPLREEW